MGSGRLPHDGTVHRTVCAGKVAFDVELLRGLDDGETDALHAATDRYRRFLELDTGLVTARTSRDFWYGQVLTLRGE